MSASQQLVERLLERRDFTVYVSGNTIVAKPHSADGFTVSLLERDNDWLVSFDGWHEHFIAEDRAIACFEFGLSDHCRLKIEYRGSFPHRWTVEVQSGNAWRADRVVGLLLFPFWRSARTEYRQNAVRPGN
jgi:hypothetical protein